MVAIALAVPTPANQRLPATRISPALCKLTDLFRQVLQQVRISLQTTDVSESEHSLLIRRLTEAEGALKFSGACSPAALIALMRQLAAAQDCGINGTGARYSNQFVVAMTYAVNYAISQPESVLFASPAAAWMSAWHALASAMPGQKPTPAALISLDVDDVAADALLAMQSAVCSAAEHCSEPRWITELDSLLLTILRADARSENFCDALMQIAASVAHIQVSATTVRQRLHWIVIRIFCEQLTQDGNIDLVQAKKILSAIVRVIRHGSASSENIDLWVREALYQLGCCEQPTSHCLAVRACFRLDWQLEISALSSGVVVTPAFALSLRDQIDAFIASWGAANLQARRQSFDELISLFEQELPCAPFASALAASIANFPVSDELPGAASLLVLREFAETLVVRHITAIDADFFVRAMDSVATFFKNPVALDERRSMSCATVRQLMRPVSQNALKAALVATLTEAEQKMDAQLDQGDHAFALVTMLQALNSAKAVLIIAEQTESLTICCALSQSLSDAIHHADEIEVDFAQLVLAWVQLCDAIEAWQERIDQEDQSVIPADADTHLSLEKIFSQEAKERLARLKTAMSDWMDDSGHALPIEMAHDAHALAGSSATVGRMDIHGWAIALEQAIEHLRILPAEWQHQSAGLLLQGLRKLDDLLSAQADQVHDEGQCAAVWVQQLIIQSNEASCAEPPDHPIHQKVPEASAFIELNDGMWLPQSDIQSQSSNNLPVATQNQLAEPLEEDVELFAVFSEEAAELLPELQYLLGQWRQTPWDESLLPPLMRLLHTLKGSARMGGVMSLGERLHAIEHELTQPSSSRELNHQKTCVLIDALQAEIEQLFGAAFVMDIARTEWPEEKPAQLKQAQSKPAQAKPAQAKPPESFQACQTFEVAQASPVVASSALIASPKIRTEMLEHASSIAAELLVGTVRASEDLQQQRLMVDELADNLARLRVQLRELELQSESRITAQLQSQNAQIASAFDPLEFDRYTRLQELTRMTAESLADLTSVQRGLARHADISATQLSQQTRFARLLQSDLRRAGMQAFSSVEQRYRHLVRQTAAEVGREVRLELDGGQTDIDRLQLDRLSGPLQHLLRNAIVHGIESPEQRESLGKPREGVVRMSLRRHGSELHLQVSDDGRGLDFMRIRERAVASGLLSADEAADETADDALLTELIFSPGLSTAPEVTELAGRGIGMDAVRAAVVRMGGAMKLDSLSGAGTCITLALPQYLSTQQVLLVSAGEQQIALPSSFVQQLVQQETSIALQAMAAGSFEWQRQTMPLLSLAALLGSPAKRMSAAQRVTIIVLRQLDQWLALLVDDIHGHREVVVKPPGAQLVNVPGLAGATLLPDGRVMLVMNPLSLYRHGTHLNIVSAPSNADDASDKSPVIMVVDDSLTMRRVSQRLLERQGYAVTLARHGMEALEQLRELTPAALLLDIEMPRMDGFELLTRLRADRRLQAIPVAMVTSRTAERHRQRAMALGANAYFGKPYREQELLAWLQRCAPVMKAGTSDDAEARVAA